MNVISVPDSELDRFVKLIKSKPDLFDTLYITKYYKKKSKKIISDPFSKNIASLIISHIKKKKPMSVIRMGDGEMNLLTYTQYPQLPKLSFQTAAESVRKRQHSFVVNKSWLFIFEQMMNTAIKEADILGVLGFWRPNELNAEQFIPTISKNIRGRWGQWTGLDYIYKLSQQNLFTHKVLASAHLYISVIENLRIIFKMVKPIYLITNQYQVIEKLVNRFPENKFILIREPMSKRPLSNVEPDFLYNVMSKLPKDMSNSLTLIGAGPWSEFYCTWIKRRNGIAIDIGSGFDLLLGKNLRPVHEKINLNI